MWWSMSRFLSPYHVGHDIYLYEMIVVPNECRRFPIAKARIHRPIHYADETDFQWASRWSMKRVYFEESARAGFIDFDASARRAFGMYEAPVINFYYQRQMSSSSRRFRLVAWCNKKCELPSYWWTDFHGFAVTTCRLRNDWRLLVNAPFVCYIF